MGTAGRDVPPDVRMRGFRSRSEVREVQAWVDTLEVPLPVERLPVTSVHDRVLAEDLVSEVDVPAFARSAMDGWALRGESTFGAAEDDPRTLQVVGRLLPGTTFPGPLAPGEALRIMTGAAVPEGADAVLRAEDGREADGRLDVRAPVPPGSNVGLVGEDVRVGGRLLKAGRRLRPQDVALAAAVGRATLRVVRRPRVGIVVTGDELVPAGTPRHGVQVVDSNSVMLEGLVRRDGGEVAEIRRTRDGRDLVTEALIGVEGDLVLVSGGSSVGEEDHAPRVLADRGELAFHGVSMRPASPSGVGRLDGRVVFLLPGHPVSCLSSYDFFAGRFVRRLGGRDGAWPYPRVERVLRRKISSVLGRVDYVRVRCTAGGVEPLMSRGAAILSSTTEADGFVVVPRDAEGYPEGATVEVYLYEVG